MERPVFASFMADSTGAQAVLTLNEMIVQLTDVCALLDYNMNRRKISLINLTTIEENIREILRKIITSSDIRMLSMSADAALDELRKARNKLNAASDILEMKKTPKRQEQLYQYYDEICILIDSAIKHLKSSC